MSNSDARLAKKTAYGPTQKLGQLVFLPFPIVMIYTLMVHSTPSFRDTKCFSFVERLTSPISESIPGIARTVRQLDALSLPDRAAEVGHYLALMWIGSAIATVTALLWQRLTWKHSNYVEAMKALQHNWEQHSKLRRSYLTIACGFLFPALVLAAPFIGGANRMGRNAHDFAGSQFEFFMGIWWIGGQGWMFFFMLWCLTFILIARRYR